MKRYQVKFVTSNGRKVNGPVFKDDEYAQYVKEIRDLDEVTVFRMHHRGYFMFVPRQAFELGHIEINRVSLLYAAWRWWRTR